MKNTILTFLLLFAALFFHSTTGFAQRTNYNEDDVVIMRSQQNTGESIMHLLEEKKIDSALFFFIDKGPTTKGSLLKISNQIQAYKAKYDFAASPDAPDDKVNHVICKYTSNEGEDTHYKIIFVFGREDRTFKVKSILFK